MNNVNFKDIKTMDKKTTSDDYKRGKGTEDNLVMMLSPEEIDFVKKAFRKSIIEDENGFWTGFNAKKFVEILQSDNFSEFMIGYMIGTINSTMAEQLTAGLSYSQALQGVISSLEQVKEGFEALKKMIEINSERDKNSIDVSYA